MLHVPVSSPRYFLTEACTAGCVFVLGARACTAARLAPRRSAVMASRDNASTGRTMGRALSFLCSISPLHHGAIRARPDNVISRCIVWISQFPPASHSLFFPTLITFSPPPLPTFSALSFLLLTFYAPSSFSSFASVVY